MFVSLPDVKFQLKFSDSSWAITEIQHTTKLWMIVATTVFCNKKLWVICLTVLIHEVLLGSSLVFKYKK